MEITVQVGFWFYLLLLLKFYCEASTEILYYITVTGCK